MTRKMKIGLAIGGIDTLHPNHRGNVQGDEMVARGWQKYLLRLDDFEVVDLYGPRAVMRNDLDAVIHFHPWTQLHPKAKNIYYLQNAFPPEMFEGGTVGVFNKVRGNYSAFMFTSEKLMKSCAPGIVLPFAIDPDEVSY